MISLGKTVVDETQSSQLVYSPELDSFLQITTIAQTEIDNQTKDWQAKIDAAQAEIDALSNMTQMRQKTLDAAQSAEPPIQQGLPPS
jgi:thiamine biosynthesis lipoprotein ApbE